MSSCSKPTSYFRSIKNLRKSSKTYKAKKQQKAQKRIFVEHVIRLLKIFGIARERFRLKEKSYEKVVMVVCGLVKLRIGALILV